MIYDVSDVKFTSVLLVYICAVYIYIKLIFHYTIMWYNDTKTPLWKRIIIWWSSILIE